MPYRLSALAERDLEEIWSYIAEDASPTTADRLIDDVIDRFDLLAEQRKPRTSGVRHRRAILCGREPCHLLSS